MKLAKAIVFIGSEVHRSRVCATVKPVARIQYRLSAIVPVGSLGTDEMTSVAVCGVMPVSTIVSVLLAGAHG